MHPREIDCYLSTAQSYALRNNDIELLDYVQQQILDYPADPQIAKFFVAERAFYQKKYQLALKNYLEAREIPNFQFFCFRVSAYVSLMMEQKEKALNFANKALSIKPEDYATLKILIEIYLTTNQKNKVYTLRKKIQSLLELEEEPHHYIPIGEEEMNELSQIFSDDDQSEEALFSLERKMNITSINTPCDDLHSAGQGDFVMPAGFELFSYPASNGQKNSSLTRRLYSFADDAMKSTAPPYKKNSLDINLQTYSNRFSLRAPLASNFFLNFDGWRKKNDDYSLIKTIVEPKSSGCFLHWNGLGIAVNPGNHFIENMHKNRLFVYDIKIVIITKPDTSEHFSQIASLCDKLQHQVDFYLAPDLFDRFSSVNRKIAQNLFKLRCSKEFQEIFVRKRHQFSYLCMKGNFQLLLKDKNKSSTLTFVNNITPNEKDFHGLGTSQILIADSALPLGNECLYKLLGTIKPKIFLYSAFNPSDQRQLQILQSARALLGKEAMVLPTEIDFLMDLDNFKVRSSDHPEYILPHNIIL